MQQIEYKDFSSKFHYNNLKENLANACQFELTFACNLCCQHCYCDCYNNPECIRKELTFKEVRFILDKIYCAGIFWVCFTGGDPLMRNDFSDIYIYAKRKGFIITIFTNGTLINNELADLFSKYTPFCIEITLNAVTKHTYEKIAKTKGSFDLVMAGIKRLKERNIPFKIKTQVTKQNYRELDEIKDFVDSLGLKFTPNCMLFARLDGNTRPCELRLPSEKVLEISNRFKLNALYNDEFAKGQLLINAAFSNMFLDDSIFRCSIGNDVVYVSPYGEMFLCSTIRYPKVDLLSQEIKDGFKFFKQIRKGKFNTDSRCKNCSFWYYCYRCPGKALLERGDMESPIDYFCNIAHLITNKKKKNVRYQMSYGKNSN